MKNSKAISCAIMNLWSHHYRVSKSPARVYMKQAPSPRFAIIGEKQMNNCQSASGRDFIKQAAGADAWSDLQSAVLSELAASQKVMPAKGPLRCFGQARSLFLQPPATFLGPCLAQWLHYDGNKCAQEIRLPTDECLLHAARGHGSDLVSDAVKVRGRRLAVGHGMGHRPSAAIRGPRLTRI